MRIQRHLARVEAELRARDTRHLSPDARAARANGLDRLHRYALTGAFPHNTSHPGTRTPYFIDSDGRACAVGHLIIESGAKHLAESVDQEFHNAYVRQMEDARLLAWAQNNGFTADELALIQPGYCQCGVDQADPQPYAPVCGSDGLTYWNACAANLCGGIEIVHDGPCTYDFPICDVCGFGTQAPVVDECRRGEVEISYGVCEKTGGEGIPTLSDLAGLGWLEIQKAACEGTLCFEAGVAASPCEPVTLTQTCWSSDGLDAGTDGGTGSGGAGGAGGAGGSGGAGFGGVVPHGGAGGVGGGATGSEPDAGAGTGGVPEDVGLSSVDSEDAGSSGCAVVRSNARTSIPVAWLVCAALLQLCARRRGRNRGLDADSVLVRRIGQLFSRYPVRKISATMKRQMPRKPSVMARLSSTPTSDVS
jgi:hypothetical protein